MNLLNQVPDNWIRTSVGKFCDVQLGKMLQNDPLSDRDQTKPYLRAINVGKTGLDLTHEFSMWIRPQEADRFRLRRGDILVSEGGDAGRTVIFNTDSEYYFQNAINRIRPDYYGRIESDFIYYWFTFLKAVGYVEMICNVATIPHFTAEKVKAAPLALPPLPTQRRIAQFLDEKTARIDALIEKKRELLDRLAEKRQALITRAVTKGLDSDVQREDCRFAEGVDGMSFKTDEDLLQRLKQVFSSCRNGAWGEEANGETDVVVIRAADFDGKLGRLNRGERTFRSVAPETYEKLALRRGDIILEKSGGGEKQLVGRAALYDDCKPSITSNFLARCRPAPDVEPNFVNYLLLAIYNGRGTFPHLKQSTGIQNLDLASFLDIQVRIPPLHTQRRIAQFLDEKTAQIDEAESKILSSVDLLFEYRATLITSAVTGQLTELL
ncbi:MAG: restriction endonuclease subunit S [Cyanobacteria bacterium MAG CAR4_bin_6]|nr:restriction endonuclease subunit S [Cyanobacteria bacterium MAG CAR4_bin_6]